LVKKVGGKEVAFFPHMDYDERTPPGAAQADLMCRTAGKMCPVAEQCLKLGLALPESSGVWGGKTLLDGKIYNQKEE
jgi:hypothetical protein